MIGARARATWPYLLPAWLHAAFLPVITSQLASFCGKSENCFAALYLLSLVVWLFPLIPVRKRLIGASHAMVLVLLPYVPWVVFSIVTMESSAR